MSIIKAVAFSGMGLIGFNVMLATIFQTNIGYSAVVLFLFPAFITIYNLTTPIIIALKKLDLKNKTPIFDKFEEMSSGITQIRLFSPFDQYF